MLERRKNFFFPITVDTKREIEARGTRKKSTTFIGAGTIHQTLLTNTGMVKKLIVDFPRLLKQIGSRVSQEEKPSEKGEKRPRSTAERAATRRAIFNEGERSVTRDIRTTTKRSKLTHSDNNALLGQKRTSPLLKEWYEEWTRLGAAFPDMAPPTKRALFRQAEPYEAPSFDEFCKTEEGSLLEHFVAFLRKKI